jgi:ketosteroid isomerase-like protein
MPGVNNIERIRPTAGSPTEERNAKCVREVFLGFSRADFDHLYAKLVGGREGEVVVIGMDPARLGHHAKNPDFIPELFCNGMTFTIKVASVDGNVVMVEWEDTAETSTGKTYFNNGLSVFTFNDEGKILAYHEYFDPEKFYEVLL